MSGMCAHVHVVQTEGGGGVLNSSQMHVQLVRKEETADRFVRGSSKSGEKLRNRMFSQGRLPLKV